MNAFASAGNDRVLRFNGTTGAAIDTFVTAGSGGLDYPVALLFRPDGYLYVTSQLSDTVLRYNATTGASLGDFVTVGSGGISAPNFMLFRPPTTPFAPVLNIAPAGNDVTLSWSTQSVGWSLQTTPTLALSPAWNLAVHPVTKNGGLFQMTLPRAADRQFFRLILP